MARWLFEVERCWKGDVPDTVVVYSARSSVSCGYEFSTGDRYLVYAELYDPDVLAKQSIARGMPADLARRSVTARWPTYAVFPALRTGCWTRTSPADAAIEDIKVLPPRSTSAPQTER
jgi:hypothetical protein